MTIPCEIPVELTCLSFSQPVYSCTSVWSAVDIPYNNCLYVILACVQVPRQVNLQLTRSGGLIGSLSVTYSVVYVPPGRPVTDGTSIFNPSQPAAATFSPGAMSFSASLGIASGSVLEVGGQVVATLSAVQLTSTTPTSSLALYSPTIGSRSRVFLTINSSLANGPIGFASSSQNVSIGVRIDSLRWCSPIAYYHRQANQECFAHGRCAALCTSTVDYVWYFPKCAAYTKRNWRQRA